MGGFIKSNIVQAFKMSSNSMVPTLLKSDRILVKKKYLLRNWFPKRYDIVVFKTPHKKEFIKRIMGFPGETIEIKEGAVLVNSTKLNLLKKKKKIIYENIGDYGEKGKSYKIPVGFYYILGDGDKSVDSRFFGFISKSDIVGRAYKIYFPFNRARKL